MSATQEAVNRVIGTRVKMARTAKNLAQEKLGGMIGRTQMTIWRIEKGLATPTPDTLDAIAEALDVSPWWIRGYPEGLPLSDERDTPGYPSRPRQRGEAVGPMAA